MTKYKIDLSSAPMTRQIDIGRAPKNGVDGFELLPLEFRVKRLYVDEHSQVPGMFILFAEAVVQAVDGSGAIVTGLSREQPDWTRIDEKERAGRIYDLLTSLFKHEVRECLRVEGSGKFALGDPHAESQY